MVIHPNFTGKILVCFIQPIQTSPDIIEVCLFPPIAGQVKFTYDDESTLVVALPELIEIALQCLQFKKIFVWKPMHIVICISLYVMVLSIC